MTSGKSVVDRFARHRDYLKIESRNALFDKRSLARGSTRVTGQREDTCVIFFVFIFFFSPVDDGNFVWKRLTSSHMVGRQDGRTTTGSAFSSAWQREQRVRFSMGGTPSSSHRWPLAYREQIDGKKSWDTRANASIWRYPIKKAAFV